MIPLVDLLNEFLDKINKKNNKSNSDDDDGDDDDDDCNIQMNNLLDK